MSFNRTLTVLLLCSVFLIAPVYAARFDPGNPPPYAAAVLMEAETGSVLFAHQPHLQRSPASTLKLLLELVAMNQVATGRYSLGDPIQVSARASRVGGSQVYLKQGEVFTLGQLMEAIIIPSANDACVAVAEHIGGSVEGFVNMMNAQAEDLGLEDTRCVNVHGLDDTPMDAGNVTSAHDLAHIARALVAYPRILFWSSIRYKPFRDGKFMLYTTNKLLGKYPGLDGLKTGYTQRAQYCLVASASRDSMRLISAVLGARSERQRDQETARLLSWGFNNFSRVPLVQTGQLVGTVTLDWGRKPEVRAITRDTAYAVLSPEQEKSLARTVELPRERPAPVKAGQELGSLKVTLGDSLLAEFDVVAESSVQRMSVWEKVTSWF